MKTFRVLLLIMSLHTITAYGSSHYHNDTNAYLSKFADLERVDAHLCKGKTISQLEQMRRAAYNEMIFGSDKDRDQIIFLQNNNAVINIPTENNSPTHGTEAVISMPMANNSLIHGTEMVSGPHARKTCTSRLLRVFTRNNNKVYVTSDSDLQ